MQLNVMDYLKGPAGGYMTGSHDMITRITPNRLVWIKSLPAKFPLDVWSIKTGKGGPGVYFGSTEDGKDAGWTDKTSVQLNVSQEPILCPLTISALPWKSDVSNPLIQTLAHGVWDGKWAQLGPTYTEIDFPSFQDWGGTVGRADTLKIKYHWNVDRETFSLAKGSGLVEWLHETIDPATGLYKFVEASVFNVFKPLAVLPDPLFGFPETWIPA